MKKAEAAEPLEAGCLLK